MRYLLLVILLIASANIAAQNDFGGSMSIAPAGSGINIAPSGKPLNSASIFDSPKTSTGSIETTPPNSNFGKPSEFSNPGDIVRDKLNKKESDPDLLIRKNQYLGDFKTKAGKVKIIYRDHEFPDGDVIKVWVNDRVLIQGIVMEQSFGSFEIDLESGFNKIDFEALNQGTSGPNTAEFRIFDDKGTLVSSNRWNLATGFKATVIVVKE